MRLLAGTILACAVFAVLYLATMRPERHPLLIDAAYSGTWCDVDNPPPRPRVKSTIEPRSPQDDQRTYT